MAPPAGQAAGSFRIRGEGSERSGDISDFGVAPVRSEVTRLPGRVLVDAYR